MLTAYIKCADGTISNDASEMSLSQAMRERNCTFWLDMLEPTPEELGLLDEVFGFHPLAIEDTTNYVQRPKIEGYKHPGCDSDQGYFYIVLHGPDLETFREHVRTKEIDIFVSERYLLTIHDKKMKSIEEVISRANSDAHLILDPGIDMLLHGIVDRMTDGYQPILDHLQEQLDDIEDKALNDPQPSVLQEISAKKRELLDLRRIVNPQREVLAQISRGDVPFIRAEARAYFRDVQDHLVHIVESVELYRDLVLGARDIYLSSISNNLNQIMKTLTIISVIALPATIVTSFFGMNFEAMPLAKSTWGFWIAMAGLGAIEAVMFWWFRRRRWL